ncbi:hypothetical protein U1U32_004064 [Cronobacter malonaticus]|nr:hypothetical protein [Cronobacter malonaticus]
MTRDARGPVVSAADPAGHQTRLRYDRFGRLTGQRDYAGRSGRCRKTCASRASTSTMTNLSGTNLNTRSVPRRGEPQGCGE